MQRKREVGKAVVHYGMLGHPPVTVLEILGAPARGVSQTMDTTPATDRWVHFQEAAYDPFKDSWFYLCSRNRASSPPQRQSAFGQLLKVQADLKANLLMAANPWTIHKGR